MFNYEGLIGDCKSTPKLSAYERTDNPNLFSPTIIGLDIFSVYECILARDRRMYNSHGGWFGHFETPTILSNQGKQKLAANIEIDYSSYGRKENEGKDLNEDTNFGKLKRIPYPPLQHYLRLANSSFNESEE